MISLYLTLVHYGGDGSPCYDVHGCEQVQTSGYSIALVVPGALFGAVFFAPMFYLAIGLLARPTVLLVRATKVLAFLAALAAD